MSLHLFHDAAPDAMVDLAVIGGGMSGLYVAANADRARYARRCVFEAAPRLGGRVQTVELGRGAARFRCELGAMRFEWGLQPTFEALVRDLGLATDDFVPYSAPPTSRAGLYALGPEEAAALQSGGGSPFALWRWAILSILRGALADAPPSLRPADLAGDEWLARLGERHVRWLRTHATVPFGAGRIPLADVGIWTLLRVGVLSGEALALVMNEGTFYHFIHKNISAAESVVFWLRVLQSNAAIKTIGGGVSALVDGLAAKVRAAGAEIRTGHRLVAITEAPGSERLLALRMERADGAVVVVHARRVVLALPAPALARLAIALPDDVRGILGDVVPMRMTKCFFLVDRPWWDDDRAQTHVGTDRCPAREIHYYSAPDRSVGMVMVYCDEPTFDFWAPLAAEDRKAEREATFAAVMGISPTRVLDSRVIDWTRVPELGAAAWFWKPGVRIYDAMRRLAAFDLAGDERDAASPRLSICGCAYSDFQGFIEGALRTAESTLDALRAPARAPEITTGLPLAMPA